MSQQTFEVRGMTCAACQSHVEHAVAALPGVEQVAVNLLCNSMSVTTAQDGPLAHDICQAVHEAGYEAIPTNAPEQDVTATKHSAEAGARPSERLAQEAHAMRGRLIGSLCFMVPLDYLGMGHMLGWPLPPALAGHEHIMVLGLVELLLVLPILYLNRSYFINGARSLLHRAPTMDALVAIGATASAAWSVWALLLMAAAIGTSGVHAAAHIAMNNLYFESAGTILALVTVGKYLETRSKSKTGSAIEALMDLAPATAHVIESDGTVRTIPADELNEGQTVLVHPGETIAADGVVIEGSAAVDESALTGEAIPVAKTTGDTVRAATLATTGSLTFRATRVGNNTTLAQIIRLVEDANATKAPISRTADRVAAVFVPAVLIIAALTILIWLVLGNGIEHALTAGISVVVISCPCALGLATPVAIMVGTGRGAEMGVLFRHAEALETLGSVTTVVFDKTGTLTEGRPVVTDIVSLDADDARASKRLLKMAAALERNSEHPLAHAVMEQAEEQGIVARPVKDFCSVPGKGVYAYEGSNRIAAGNIRLMHELGVTVEESLANSWQQTGKTVLYLAKDDHLVGLIAVSDTVRATAPLAIEALHELGIRPVMLTGDTQATAQATARCVGIALGDVRANTLPQDKEAYIRELQAQGAVVAMVGDGINDSPALARAHVGIAVASGTDIAKEGADVMLMRSEMLDVAHAIRLSRATVRTIRQGLFWALLYNALGIPLAAGVLYPLLGWQLSPMFAAAAMSLSSVCVVSNALRLKGFRVPTPERS